MQLSTVCLAHLHDSQLLSACSLAADVFITIQRRFFSANAANLFLPLFH